MTKMYAGTEFLNQPIGNGKTSIFTDMRELFDGTNSKIACHIGMMRWN